MPRRSRVRDPESIRQELVALLEDFHDRLSSPDLRSKILALVPAIHLLNDLGASLVSEASARDRILAYLLRYPRIVIDGRELMVVAGISEYARRVRELRTEFGWFIASGITCTEEWADGGAGETMSPDQYMLMSTTQDRQAAYRWKVANDIRKTKLSVQDKILRFLQHNTGVIVSNEELRYVAGNATEWARRVRELRTEHGWQIATKHTGRPDLDIGQYLLESKDQLPEHDRVISDASRIAALDRDGHACTSCSWTYATTAANPADPRKRLELHHIVHHANGGSNETVNLLTLCNICHDQRHAAERHERP
jgi:hypothetical protein